MAKRLLSVWLSLVILVFSSISVYAEDFVQGSFFYKKININGVQITNYNLQYPFFIYKNSAYIPLTSEIGDICGFEAKMDTESRTLKIKKKDITKNNIADNWPKNQGQNLSLKVMAGAKVIIEENQDRKLNESEKTDDIVENEKLDNTQNAKTQDCEEDSVEGKKSRDENTSECGNDISKNTKEKVVDMSKLPLIVKGNYVYIPIKVFVESDSFKWNTHYDTYTGISISTKKDILASTYWNQEESVYNKVLSEYIMKHNRNLTPTQAQRLVFYFKRAANVHNIDEKLIMVMAQKESSFNAGAVSRGGARGIMQLMPGTGANFGMNKYQMHDARMSINAGASMIRAGLDLFGGDVEKAISSYNQGSYRVKKGRYSKRYAIKISNAYSNMNSYLKARGI